MVHVRENRTHHYALGLRKKKAVPLTINFRTVAVLMQFKSSLEYNFVFFHNDFNT